MAQHPWISDCMERLKREELELSARCCVSRADQETVVDAMCGMDQETARCYIRLLMYGFPITTAAREARKATAAPATPSAPRPTPSGR